MNNDQLRNLVSVLISAGLLLIALFLPVFEGQIQGSGDLYSFVGYWSGGILRTNLSDGDTRLTIEQSYSISFSLATMLILVGIGYLLATLHPKFRAGKLNIIAGVIVIFALIAAYLGFKDSQIYVPGFSEDQMINSFAQLLFTAIAFPLIASGLSIASGVLSMRRIRLVRLGKIDESRSSKIPKSSESAGLAEP